MVNLSAKYLMPCVCGREMGKQMFFWTLESTTQAWRVSFLISGAWRMWVHWFFPQF